jgi:hypothetical protein
MYYEYYPGKISKALHEIGFYFSYKQPFVLPIIFTGLVVVVIVQKVLRVTNNFSEKPL